MIASTRTLVTALVLALASTGCSNKPSPRETECALATSAVQAAVKRMDGARLKDQRGKALYDATETLAKVLKEEGAKLDKLVINTPEVSTKVGAFRSYIDTVTASAKRLSLATRLASSYDERIKRVEKDLAASEAALAKACESSKACDDVNAKLKAHPMKGKDDAETVASRAKLLEALRGLEIKDEGVSKVLGKLIHSLDRGQEPLEKAGKANERVDKARETHDKVYEGQARLVSDLQSFCSAPAK